MNIRPQATEKKVIVTSSRWQRAQAIIAMVMGSMPQQQVVVPANRHGRARSSEGFHRSGSKCDCGAFGGKRRKRLGSGALDLSPECAKAGRRGGRANPWFGQRVGEQG